MMKIAIPLFDRRVSPRFDCAQDFLLASVENGEIIERRKLLASDWTCRERVKKLCELGVETLICGGIDRLSAGLLAFYGVMIYSWVTGMAEDALRTFLRGELESGTMVGSGGRPCGKWRFRGKTMRGISSIVRIS
jgi:predicted Fe-Mo cluster-binding NifX family protein